jgi:streptomycin 6-kinase
MVIPEQLIENCHKVPERRYWLDNLPALLHQLTDRWSLRVGAPFDHANVTCSWVAPAVRADGKAAVLKLGMPHMEGADEIQGLASGMATRQYNCLTHMMTRRHAAGALPAG